MTTQKIAQTISPGSPNQISSKNAAGNIKDLTSSFTAVMSQTISLKTAGSSDIQQAADQSKAGTSESSGSSHDNNDMKTVSKDVSKIRKTDASVKTASADDSSGTDSKIEDAADKVRQKIKDDLGISDDELNAAMQALGLANADLLNPSVIPALTAKITGNDISAVITDETMYSQVSDIQSAQRDVTADLLQDLNMTADEFMKAVQDTASAEKSSDSSAQIISTSVSDAGITAEESVPADGNVQKSDNGQTGNTANEVNAVQGSDDSRVKITVESPIKDTVRTPAEAANLNGSTSVRDTAERISQTDENGTDNLSKISDNVFGKDKKSAGDSSEFSQPSQSGSSNPGASLFQNLTQSIDAAVGRTDETLSTPYSTYADAQNTAQNIMDQITGQIKVALKSDSTSMEMQLNPESLGKLSIQVVSKNGAVTAQFEAQSASVKAALETQVTELKQSLENQGIKVENVEVTVASHQFEQSMMQNGNSNTQDTEAGRRTRTRHINLNDQNDAEGVEDIADGDEDTKIVRSMMKANGNSVDFMA